MASKKSNRPVLFYVLVSYILLQFIWWEVLLVKQTREIQAEKEKIVALGATSHSQLSIELAELSRKEKLRIYMIIGEGTIFLIIITIGIIRVYKAHKKEKEIAAQQKNFLLSVSHELKTPLATGKLGLQTLLTRDLSKEARDKILRNAIYENERLTQLIENILMSARLDDGNVQDNVLINKEKVNLSDLCNEIINGTFTDDQKQLISNAIEPNVFLDTDKAVFPSLLINLIENAFKYSPLPSKVEVVLRNMSNNVVLEVKDFGTGIRDDDKNKIFQKFYRIGSEETRKTKGTGLGLFIVKRIVEMHNGSIKVKNNLPNGSIFEVSFPIS